MGNMLYQPSDNVNTIKGDKTAKNPNYRIETSLLKTKDLTNSLVNYNKKTDNGYKG